MANVEELLESAAHSFCMKMHGDTCTLTAMSPDLALFLRASCG